MIVHQFSDCEALRIAAQIERKGERFYRMAAGVAKNGPAEKLLEMLPPQLKKSYEPLLFESDPATAPIVKAADKLSAHIKCIEELKAGNLEFREAAAQTRAALEAYDLPEVAYFMDTFMDSFSLTLDQLK